MKIMPVILSGGSGTRLWPLSRTQYPKQYLPLVAEKTLLQETILRLGGLDNLLDPIIVCNAEHRFLVAGQCQQIGVDNPTILLEPVGKNTAPAIAVAALQSLKMAGNAILLVLSADHIIEDVEAFHQALKIASKQAQSGKLVTFGIKPTAANIGYGYIKSAKNNDEGAFEVEEFVEKPDLQTAQNYLQQGNYLWNSGMFMFQAQILLDELRIYAPDIVKSANNAVANASADFDFIRLEKQAFESLDKISIDEALMEKSDNIRVVPLDVKWRDIGSWSALYDIGSKDENGNVIAGSVIAQDTTNSYINANHRMIATIGVHNLIVVDTADATFIAAKDKAQAVKNIVAQLKNDNRAESEAHRKVYRPWGWYDSIEAGKYFQVKRLHINPQSKLSLQSHQQRAEHWVVITGTASVVNGENNFELQQGQSTYIALGTKHSLANNTNAALEVIEVQSGVYLGEDDIERFEDIYGRAEE